MIMMMILMLMMLLTRLPVLWRGLQLRERRLEPWSMVTLRLRLTPRRLRTGSSSLNN